jgi:hypothetical protein
MGLFYILIWMVVVRILSVKTELYMKKVDCAV